MNEIEKAIQSCENQIRKYENRLTGADFHRGATMNSIKLEGVKIAALREKAEREKGCEYCTDISRYKGFGSAEFFHQTAADEQYEISVDVKFCPNCGKQLGVEHAD